MEELTISVIIADRPYRLTIKREEEEIIRKAAGSINNMIKEYSANYAFNDKQDLLAMVALEFTTRAIRNEGELKIKDELFIDKLKKINTALSENI
jgi:cell division protein ZapA